MKKDKNKWNVVSIQISPSRFFENDYTCDGCGRVEKAWNTIDNWAKIGSKYYCLKCQERLGVGWFKKPKTK